MPYRPALPPRAHQREAAKRLAQIQHHKYGDAFALLMEMGTGKSKVICDEFGERVAANDLSDLLIIAPAGCYGNWIDDHVEQPSEFHKQMDPRVYEDLVTAKWRSGGGVTNRRLLSQMIHENERPRAFVMNAEALASAAGAQECVEAFFDSSRKGVMVVVDESPLMKGRDALRTEIITKLGEHSKVASRRILSGLVTPHSPLDLYSQFNFLNWRILGFRSFFGFRARYAILRSMKVGVQTGKDGQLKERKIIRPVAWRNIDELHDKIEPFSYRVLKDDCLDLPKKQYVSRDVELSDDQRRIYDEMKRFATSQLSESAHVTASMVLAQRLRLSQVLVGYTFDESGNLHEIKEKRSKALIELIDQYQGKAIIWSGHDYCIRKLAAKLRDEYGPNSVAQFWGGNRNTRAEDERRFKTDPRCRFMLSTQAAGGRGNNWTVAGLSVYYDNTDSLDHRAQSEDRNHRDGLQLPGGAGSVLYVDLIARGSIDERKIKSLRNKIDIASVIQGDDYREWLI